MGIRVLAGPFNDWCQTSLEFHDGVLNRMRATARSAPSSSSSTSQQRKVYIARIKEFGRVGLQ
jgi:hypothetical protein